MVQKISDITELSITHENDTDAESPDKIKQRKMPVENQMMLDNKKTSNRTLA